MLIAATNVFSWPEKGIFQVKNNSFAVTAFGNKNY